MSGRLGYATANATATTNTRPRPAAAANPVAHSRARSTQRSQRGRVRDEGAFDLSEDVDEEDGGISLRMGKTRHYKNVLPRVRQTQIRRTQGLCADAKFRLNGLATKEKSSAFGNGSKLLHGEKSLLENYLTDSIHVKC